MRELIIARRKLYERSKAMRDLTFFYKKDSLDRKRKEQDKVYKQWKFYDGLVKAMEESK